jgi:hypothetical protein
MKKKLLVLSIISVVLTVLGFVCAFIAFQPNFGSALAASFTSMFAFGAMLGGKDFVWLATAILSIAGLVLIIVFWVMNLVRLIVTKSKQWIAVDVLGILGGLIGVIVFSGLLNKYAFVNYAQTTHQGDYCHSFIDAFFEFHSEWAGGKGANFPLIEDGQYVKLILGILAVAAVIVGWSFALKALIVSRKIMEGKVKENGAKEEAEEAAADTAKEGEGAPSSEDELRGAEDAELNDQEEGKGVGPYVVQYFNYGPAPKAAPEEKPEEADEDEEMLTSDDLRKIIREEMHIDPNAPKASSADADQIREIVKEEIAKALQGYAANNKPQDNSLTTEQVRTVVSQELDKRHYVVSEPKKEEPKPQPKLEPAPAPVVVQVVAAPAPTPAPAPAPVVEDDKKKVVRVPFPERLEGADKEMKANYNEIKAEALSFGLKSRLSNSGDTFRLHTKTYLKITVAGKGLKLYYALDPKAYENSPIPLKDVSNKNIYKEIPGCFKVKSDLSVKRAKQLIADACEKDNLEQGKPEIKNYAAEMKDYKPQSGDDDDGDDDDDDK